MNYNYYIDFINYIGLVYTKKMEGEKCIAAEVINSKHICKMASDALKVTYQAVSKFNRRPAGCYWSGSNAYYNEPAVMSASAEYTGARGGICFSKGIPTCQIHIDAATKSNMYDVFLITIIPF